MESRAIRLGPMTLRPAGGPRVLGLGASRVVLHVRRRLAFDEGSEIIRIEEEGPSALVGPQSSPSTPSSVGEGRLRVADELGGLVEGEKLLEGAYFRCGGRSHP